jgi:hypothetical protein
VTGARRPQRPATESLLLVDSRSLRAAAPPARAFDVIGRMGGATGWHTEPAGASARVPLPCFALEDVLVTIETIAMPPD